MWQVKAGVQKRIFRVLIVCTALMFAQIVFANGTLTHMSGQVSVEKAEGSTLAGIPGLQLLPGDTLITGINGFVRMEMTDGGEIVLRPDSHLKIDKYRFDKDKPTEDSFVFSILKGGFRTVTGLIGKRGNRDAYQAVTKAATVGIRGTQYDLRVCQGGCGTLSDGTYVAVRYGAISVGNSQGNMEFKAGQVGHIPPSLPPVLLPRDPGVGFTPPATIPKLDEKKKVQQQEETRSQGISQNQTSGGVTGSSTLSEKTSTPSDSNTESAKSANATPSGSLPESGSTGSASPANPAAASQPAGGAAANNSGGTSPVENGIPANSASANQPVDSLVTIGAGAGAGAGAGTTPASQPQNSPATSDTAIHSTSTSAGQAMANLPTTNMSNAPETSRATITSTPGYPPASNSLPDNGGSTGTSCSIM